ncbi:MAG: ATP-binding protein [Chloroflexi bacterium]|nr:ATP-binding protein [Chloroflexota bacterium]
MTFVGRERELAALEQFWRSGRAECIPVTGRRRVGKTYLLEHFAQGKRAVYYRCLLTGTAEQLPVLGQALADLAGDPVLQAQPPATWPAVLALIEQLARHERLLLVLDEVPYWAARDASLPSVLQNWWDGRGRTLNLMLVLCGSAVQMMEGLLTGPAPLAGCITGRMPVRPLDFRAAADLLGFADPVTTLAAYGILGGVPLYLTFFRPERSLRDNILTAIVSPASRLYVEPQAVFAAHHQAYDARSALAVLRVVAQGHHRWSDIAEAAGVNTSSLTRVMEPLIGDLGLIERVLPVTETHPTRTYYTQYHLTDNFFRFWFRFIEPNQGHIEFGDVERITDLILAQLPDYMGLPFEAMCRDWVRMASAAGGLPRRVGRVGTWWSPDHQVDVVGLDEEGRAAILGEAKWHAQPFDYQELERYLGHVRALGSLPRPDVLHLLFARAGFTEDVRRWAAASNARLLTPEMML